MARKCQNSEHDMESSRKVGKPLPKISKEWGNESMESPLCGLRGDTFLQSPHLILSSDTSLPHGPGAAVGFGRGVGLGVGLGVGEGVAVGVAVAVGVSESVVVVSDVATTFATGVSVDAPVAC